MWDIILVVIGFVSLVMDRLCEKISLCLGYVEGFSVKCSFENKVEKC